MKIKNFAIALLIILNLGLIYYYKNMKTIKPSKLNNKNNFTLYDKIIKIDTLIIKNWVNKNQLFVNFQKPTLLLFFSRDNCQSCISTIIDFLNNINNINYYIISVDIRDEIDIIPYKAKYDNYNKFNKLIKVNFDEDFNYPLPVLLLIDDQSQILLVKSFPPLDNYNEDKLFWERMKYLMKYLK